MEVNEKCPTCGRSDCFGYQDGYCVVLSRNDFGDRSCPFFKTEEQVAKEKEYVNNRLENITKNAEE